MIHTRFEPLQEHFLENFKLIVNNKIVKSGKLRLLLHKDYYAVISYIDDKERVKNFDVPYPFKLTEIDPGVFELDYTIDTLCNSHNGMNDLKIQILSLNLDNKHEWWDSKIILKFEQPIHELT